jgi:ribosomal protein L16 Arg81 hydroxylase
MTSRQWNLSELIHPVDAETFGRDYWEKQTLLIQRDTPEYYAQLLTLADMDQLLSVSSLHESEVQLVSSGRKLAVKDLVVSRPGGLGQGLEALYDRYRSGATITWMFLHQRWPALGGLCRSMAAELSATVHANAYLTPPGAQGFSAHYDTHDVFVAQVYGTKHWRLYSSRFSLPLENQRFGEPEGGLGGPVRELDLMPGDLLYLPRGTVHDATSNDTASLHLTVGAAHPTWAELLHLAVNQAASVDRRYREALPIGFARDQALVSDSERRLAELIGALACIPGVASLVGKAALAIAARNRPALGGHLLDLEAMPSLDLDTPVRRRPDLSWVLTANGETTSLEFHGKAVRLPSSLAAEVRLAAAGGEFTGRGLPGNLDEASRMLLITTLLREGFLTAV